ncbi:MAG: hypothetical protein A2776_00795 [Candidatus Levybacteria bacterium RIFCSPHIGHO2_01_FULL_40_10]|nr:MAG: hypothetical protein A2776_00795 [Candidatus Levybacteria bacterium RIFCSPHIGHO2_01_FULL_40_10]
MTVEGPRTNPYREFLDSRKKKGPLGEHAAWKATGRGGNDVNPKFRVIYRGVVRNRGQDPRDFKPTEDEFVEICEEIDKIYPRRSARSQTLQRD